MIIDNVLSVLLLKTIRALTTLKVNHYHQAAKYQGYIERYIDLPVPDT